MGAEFYRAFEEKYRGSRQLIKWRLHAYLPFIEPIAALLPDVPALDLGCGRGEWLELLQEAGIPARGVDLDDVMLASCRKRGLDVVTQDAIEALREQPDASLAIVSAFHLVEHLPFEAIQDLVREAIRVLMPGGLLIMETPNPENIAVASCSFYLDPTHIRPIPPQLLAFLPDYAGFETVKILRLQEAHDLLVREEISLADVLTGVSPDFAVVAQKAPPADAPPVAGFDRAYGISLDDLLERYQRTVDRQIEQLTAEQVRAREDLEARAYRLEVRVNELEAQLQQAVQQAHEAQRAVTTLDAIYHSTSWRLTGPFRALGSFLKKRTGADRHK